MVPAKPQPQPYWFVSRLGDGSRGWFTDTVSCGRGRKVDLTYKVNGLPAVPDFHGGDANFTSITYLPISTSVQQTLAALIIDGVFDKFPRLKWGAIELGASWLPGWLRNLDSAAHAFVKNEERLRKLSDKPSEIARRQLRVTPYPHEDSGWIIQNSHEEMCLFSTDYPTWKEDAIR